MFDNDLEYKIIKADASISHFVERFWMLANHSDNDKEIVVIPDGRIDILFSCSTTEPFHITLMGLESEPTQTTFPKKTLFFAVNLKLLAIEYLLNTSISNLVNQALQLPPDFWGITRDDLNDFYKFCEKISNKIKTLLPQETDNRKQKLFELIYASNGSLTVKALSEKVYWTSRQINRYFNQQFGLSLKAYCNILRFRASFQHIKEGKLFPEQNFTDQAHFIKEIKRLSGVTPKELFKNKNDRFIQFSALPPK
ncbi:helix-turn-helix domain-containing protein [Mucilaginibacter sp. OK098]|uniref:helix-turn-helix domain-containing protein n=1 Tax=Mucilaginibacter sp. OK098 TaxID=1855297 RepID=UPI00091257DA|nr:AraC family transcriptional regulator [Mucilaginibacter sp. OK098]SHN20913.1 AraC-type DNA-binding protein [Mucilaginibacter sp. OK098]